MSTDRYDFGCLSVLVVDDNRHMSVLVQTVLQTFGFKSVRAVGGVAEALKELQNFPVDIIITDWNMEPVDGLELVRLVRDGGGGVDSNLAIIMLSGHAEIEHVRVARNTGVNEFLAKPISAESLYACLVSVIENARTFDQTGDYSQHDRRQRARESLASAPEPGEPK